jgi:periplasmic protein CpxP/Spy
MKVLPQTVIAHSVRIAPHVASKLRGNTHSRLCADVLYSQRTQNDSYQTIKDRQETEMAMTAESREQVATELKRFAADLKLTEEQKEKLHTALAEGREKVGEYMKAHPATTKAEIVAKVKEHRGEIHERIATFLNTEQLGKWDNEVAKAKEFLGQRLDS